MYCVRLIPLGGYVSMAGEEVDDDGKVPKDKKLYNKPWYKKLIIVLAGVINNFILAFVVLFVIALIYGSYSTKPVIGVFSKDSACQKAGFEIGDKIIKINDDDAVNMSRRLAKELGLGVGISSGANFIGSVLLGEEAKNIVVTVFADDNKKYLSTDLLKPIDEDKEFISNKIELISYENI